MALIGWKPLVANFAMPSARIRCSNIIRNFPAGPIRVEVFREQDFATRYDAVIFSKNYSEESIAQAEALKKNGKKVIFDLFDNRIFSPDDSDESRALNDRLSRMIALSDHLTTSTPFLKELLSTHAPDRTITNIEDAVEQSVTIDEDGLGKRLRAYLHLLLYRAKLQAEGDKTRLVWFGTSGDKRLKTGMADLLKLKDVLHDARFKDRVVLSLCSNGKKTFDEYFADWTIPLVFINWNAATFYDVLQANHVALIPVTPNPLTYYKTNNRVITALYNNLAVIADEIPSYKEFEHCITLNDWEAGLTRFVGNEASRKSAVAEGRRIIERKYLPAQIAAKWEAFLSGAVK